MNAPEAAGAFNPEIQPVASAEIEPAEAEPPGVSSAPPGGPSSPLPASLSSAGPSSDYPPAGFAHQSGIVLRQMMDALAQVRRRGCHDASLSLTRPTPMIEGMCGALTDAGIRYDVVRASAGCSRLILWS